VPSVRLHSTLVAGNFALDAQGQPTLTADLASAFESLGFNLIGDARAILLQIPLPTDQLGGVQGLPPVDPKLGPLKDNGGLTLTHALLPGSPAIDRGQSSLATDQRGGVRRVDLSAIPNGQGDGSDIGAVEMGNHQPNVRVQFVGAVLGVTFSADLGVPYVVEYKDDLATGAWLPLGMPMMAVDELVSVTDNRPAAAQRYYRVRVAP
jgi:hypothetical protein